MLDPSSGTFNITVDKTPWFTGYGYNHFDSSVSLAGEPQRESGSDELGQFDSVSLHWKSQTHTNTSWITSIRAYGSVGFGTGGIVFRQEWPLGATLNGRDATNTHDSRPVVCAWPALAPVPKLGYVQYAGSSAGFMTKTGSFPQGMQAPLPI